MQVNTYFIGGPLDDSYRSDIEETVTVFRTPEIRVSWSEAGGEMIPGSERVVKVWHEYHRIERSTEGQAFVYEGERRG